VSAGPDLRSYLEARRTTIDEALERYLPMPPECPPVLSEAMRYSLFAGGKRLRPILTIATAEAVAEAEVSAGAGRPADGSHAAVALALPVACAIELIHTYSLVHDDLPAMDDDSLRRGRPTAHVVYGEGQAILAGDGLLTEAFALMAREPRADRFGVAGALSARKLQAIATVAEAAGALGMVGGQALDLQAAGGGAPLDADGVRAMHTRKTGALIRAASVAGAIMAGASPAARDAIDACATELGLAFQIVDDILDVEGAPEALGKTTGKDAAAGKPTYPALFGLDESRRLADACLARALTALENAGLGGRLPDLARWIVERSS
jgi:geranylgeranyl diphosphate synthase, type II